MPVRRPYTVTSATHPAHLALPAQALPRLLANRIFAMNTLKRSWAQPSTFSAPPRPGLWPCALLLSSALLWACCPVTAWAKSPAAAGKTSTSSASGGKTDRVALDFVNADIEAVARTMATVSRRNVVVDPRVKGTITLTSSDTVTPSQAMRMFSLQLRTAGYALVESEGLLLVVPEAEAKLQSGAVSIGNDGPKSSGQIVTQVFRLQHESAQNLVTVLRPLISPNNVINATPGSNTLVITDYAENLQRLAKLIAALDTANATGVDVVALKNAVASDVAPIIQRLLENQGSGGPGAAGEAGFRTTVLPEPRSNALIVRAASPARLLLVRQLIDQLDQPPAPGSSGMGNIHVVYLKNADATKLATTLRAAIAGTWGGNVQSAASSTPTTPSASGATAASGSFSSTGSATGGQIQADVATNSLIITATEPQYRQIRAVIDKLDARRAQVYVESLIAEVNADKAAEFGIQWQTPLGTKGDTNVGVLGTNYNIGGANIVSLALKGATGAVLPSAGINLGIGHMVNGKYILAMLGRFFESSGDGNVLSTPNLLTLDNEEAKIVVGQNVPFVTGQYTNNNTSGATVNPFQTIERKDVGLTLRVKPQISENGSIKLQIYQEISSIAASSLTSSTGLITNKRSVESSVLVDDGGIIVIGGLLQDEYSGSQEGVPGLSSIPWLGNLFKAESKSRRKTNLMIFLRPVVVRDAYASENLAYDRYEAMRSLQTVTQPDAGITGVQGAPVLPARAAPVPPAPVAPAAATTPATKP